MYLRHTVRIGRGGDEMVDNVIVPRHTYLKKSFK